MLDENKLHSEASECFMGELKGDISGPIRGLNDTNESLLLRQLTFLKTTAKVPRDTRMAPRRRDSTPLHEEDAG